MSNTIVYMLIMLAMASGMVMLLFGFSSMHSSLFALQSAIDEQEDILRRTNRAQQDMATHVTQWQKSVDDLTSKQQHLQSSIEAQDRLISEANEVQRQASQQLHSIQETLDRLKFQQKTVVETDADLSSRLRTEETSLHAAETKITQVQELIDATIAQNRAWQDLEQQFEQRTESTESELREIVINLTHTMDLVWKGRATAPVNEQDHPTKLPPHTSQATIASTEATTKVAAMTKAAESTLNLISTPSTANPASTPKKATNAALTPPGASAINSASTQAPTSPHGAMGVASSLTPAASSVSKESSFSSAPNRSLPSPEIMSTREPTGPSSPVAQGVVSTQQSAVVSTPSAGVVNPGAQSFRISWVRECGCTGMEIEAVTLLMGLVARLGEAFVMTNKCLDTCTWPAAMRLVLDHIEVDKEPLLWDEKETAPAGKLILVIHRAFSGVCGLPDALLEQVYQGAAIGAASNWRQSSNSNPVAMQPRGHFRVSRSMLETDRIDKDSVERCNTLFDAVWVPSQFNLRTFSDSGVKTELLKVVPEAVDPTLYNCSSTGGKPPNFGVEELDRFLANTTSDKQTFTFLSIFKWEERKNWKMLLETFFKTFPDEQTTVTLEDGRQINMIVRLLIKTQKLEWSTDPDEDLKIWKNVASVANRILVVKKLLPLALLPSLYHAADAFVLPSHGEGWGLPMMEAMASGLPTIATGWGGQTEYMHSGNSFLLGYNLTAASIDEHEWAIPKADDLQKAMWDVVQRTQNSHKKTTLACQEVPGERFTPAVVAQHIDELIRSFNKVVYT